MKNRLANHRFPRWQLSASKNAAAFLLWVNNGLYRQPCHTSAYPPEADENDAKADVPPEMSAIGGRADVACQELSRPFLANTGSQVH
jgi:hypothetical protein